MNEAIKLAIEKGGYLKGRNYFDPTDAGIMLAYRDSDSPDKFLTWREIILDPLFWQSLGKALGWERIMGWDEAYSPAQDEAFEWYHNAMIYYHTLLTGGDTEKFWQNLLKGNQ